VLTILVCAFSLTAHWAFMYWYLQQLNNLPDVREWTEPAKQVFKTQAMTLVMVTSIVGNFLAAFAARWLGYRRAIALMCVLYFLSMCTAYARVPGDDGGLLWWYVAWYVPIGMCQGVFGLFTMYLPPLFPTLLRTTGAGFCYNIGRIAAAAGTVFFGMYSELGDHRLSLLYASFLFLPAAAVAMMLMEPPDEQPAAGGRMSGPELGSE
jgi:MFS family permease